MTDKPLEQILNEFRNHCIAGKRIEDSAKLKKMLEDLEKSGKELRRLGESLLNPDSEEIPAPVELKGIYAILDADSAERYLNRTEHYEIRRLVRVLISKYPSFIEQHGQELDRRLVTRAKQDLDQINTCMNNLKSQVKAYEQQALEKSNRGTEIQQTAVQLQSELNTVYALFKQEMAICEAEVNRGRICSLRKIKSLDQKSKKIAQEIEKCHREIKQVQTDLVNLKASSDSFTARTKTEIGERFILGTLNADFLMGISYKERLAYLAQTENGK